MAGMISGASEAQRRPAISFVPWLSDRRVVFALTLALVVALGGHAWGAEGGKPGGGGAEAAFVAQILLLMIVGRGLGEVLERFGQPAIMGQLIGGILLGPSLFGWLWPSAQHLIFADDPNLKSMANAISQLGILLLLLLTGMETDLRLVRKVGAACVSISVTGVLVPFICGFGLAQILPDSLLPNPAERLVAGLFLGTALSISSVKIVAMIVREMHFMRRNLGQVIVSSAIIEDTIGWVIIAITFGIATNGKLELLPLAKTVAEVAVFMVVSLTIGRRIVFTLIRWSNDVLKSEFAVVTVILCIMMAMALITDAIGVHTVLGAFVAGILVGESPILAGHIEEQLRGVITALFMPVFFGLAGLSADLTVLADPKLLMLTAVLVAVASVGKFTGAFVGGKLGKMSGKEAMAVGCAMNARGSTEVIVASIGLSMGILSHDLFTMIVTMAVLTTLAMPPMLRWALARVPMGDGEQERVDRENLDERGFVSKLERLLLVVDDSAVGKFTASITGLIGGSSGMPTTLLRLDGDADAKADQANTDGYLELIEDSARASARAVEESEDQIVDEMHLTARTAADGLKKAVVEEAEKGFDLMLLGMDTPLGKDGASTGAMEDALAAFAGPACVVIGGDADKPLEIRAAQQDPCARQRHRGGASRGRLRSGVSTASQGARQGALCRAPNGEYEIVAVASARGSGPQGYHRPRRTLWRADFDIHRTGMPADEAIRRESEKGVSFVLMAHVSGRATTYSSARRRPPSYRR